MADRLAGGLYVGSVRHVRHRPVPHDFRYRLFLTYLDLAEIERMFAGCVLWSATRPAPARFRRDDHWGDPARPLDSCLRDLVETRCGFRPTGPIRLLTHLRYFGHVTNPVSFYYCFEPDGATLAALVAEVNNTPWGERHMYVLDARGTTGERVLSFANDKEFHVSPFLPMGLRYDWRVGLPGDRLTLRLGVSETTPDTRDGDDGEPARIERFDRGSPRRGPGAPSRVLDVALDLERREWTTSNRARVLCGYPFLTARVLAGIYRQALSLWWKGCPFHPHPRTVSSRDPRIPAVLRTSPPREELQETTSR
jgi:DUF1365 family protein